MNMFHHNRYNAETAVLLYLQIQKKRLHVPEGSCNRFLYFVLLLLSEQAHFYLVRLILLFTFTASATAAQQIAKINPKIIIILFLSFF